MKLKPEVRVGPPGSCTCEHYFEVNGQGFHEEHCANYDPEAAQQYELDSLEARDSGKLIALEKEIEELS